MNRIKRVLILGLYVGCLLSSSLLTAQNVVVKASIDSSSILIGKQTMIRLEIAANKGQALLLPAFRDTIVTGIEVIETVKPDTVELTNNRIKIKQNYLVTSFDSALYHIPAFRVVSGRDTFYSGSLGLKVSSLPVDTNSGKFYDIKSVVDPKFVWTDYLWILLIVFAAHVLGALILILIQARRKKPLVSGLKKSKPSLPADVVAINDLNDLKLRKLWQQGRSKEYHSFLTDILRQYIERRFEINALEMTSGEILAKVSIFTENHSANDNLKQILLLADFVKFAKYNPLPDEQELSLVNAYLFVNQTKKVDIASKKYSENENQN